MTPTRTPTLARLLRRADFLACARARRWTTPSVIVQMRPREDGSATVRVGLTASKKVGGAVERNRRRRRLREAMRQLGPDHCVAGCDYVLIAREATAKVAWPALLGDLQQALTKLARPAIAARASTPDPTEGPDGF